MKKSELKTIIKECMEELNEATDVGEDELEPKQQSTLKSITKFMRQNPIQIQSGIHGDIVWYGSKELGSHKRIPIEKIKMLAKLKIRWIQIDDDGVTIGF